MTIYIKILPDDEKKWYPVECDKCGWIGSSEFVAGGGQIADTGDYNDPICPCCGSFEINETENDQLFPTYIERLNKATAMVKTLTEKVEGCDCSKHIYGHLEKENERMARELYELKNK